MPVEIRTGTSGVTVIIVWETTPETQQQILDLHVEQNAEVARVPGFISANMHASLDGLRVVNYSQWESLEAFEAMIGQQHLAPRREKMKAISKNDRHVYTVVST